MKKIVIAMSTLLLFSGCRKEALPAMQTNDEVNGTGTVQKVKIEKPVVISNLSVPDRFSPVLQCLPAEYGIRLYSEATLAGTCSYLGEIQKGSRLYIKQCNMGAGVSSVTTSGQWELISTTGDRLLLRSEERISLISGTLAGILTINGGTGVYNGATGMISIRGTVELKTGIARRTGTGTIVFRENVYW